MFGCAQDPYYGGAAPTWSHETWTRICADFLEPTSQIIHVDFHTGLGPFGECEVIFVGEEESANFQLATKWFGKDRVIIPGADRSSSADVSGPVAKGLLDQHPQAMCVAFEFGTVPINTMLKALIASNWLRHNPDCDAQVRDDILNTMRAAFLPSQPEWMEKVWRYAQTSISKVLADLI